MYTSMTQAIQYSLDGFRLEEGSFVIVGIKPLPLGILFLRRLISDQAMKRTNISHLYSKMITC